MVAVNPEILIWARENAALSIDEAARKLGYKDSSRSSASNKLLLLESGQKEPTRPQLKKMSKAYHQPLLTFYLSKPPKRGDRGEDFRNLPQRTTNQKGNAHLDFLMRNIKASQNLVHYLLEDMEDFVPLPFVNSATYSMGIERVAHDIVNTLKFDLTTFRNQKTSRDAFKYLRQKVENIGIFVLLASDLGSHHSTIPLEVFRGFTFADPIAPFIVINRQDAVSAWNFTTLHEVTHLWLGKSGVSGSWGEAEVERFCDNVAASILLPTAEFNDLPSMLHAELDDAAAAISSFAEAKNISRTMVAYNLLKQEKIRQSIWHALSARFAAEWEKLKDYERASRQKDSGPSYYAVRRFHLGPALVGLAKYFVSTGELTPSKAGVVLGVNPAKVYRLLYPERASR